MAVHLKHVEESWHTASSKQVLTTAVIVICAQGVLVGGRMASGMSKSESPDPVGVLGHEARKD